jgi:hypothetical protein
MVEGLQELLGTRGVRGKRASSWWPHAVLEEKRWKHLFCVKERRQRIYSDGAEHAFSAAGEEVALERPATQLAL